MSISSGFIISGIFGFFISGAILKKYVDDPRYSICYAIWVIQYDLEIENSSYWSLQSEGQSAFSTGWEVCWMMFCIATVLVVLLGFQWIVFIACCKTSQPLLACSYHLQPDVILTGSI